MTREERAEIARRAAEARWARDGGTPLLIAHYGAPDRPLRIGSVEIPCYVLSDGTRLLAQRGLQSGIGMSEGGGQGGARKIAAFMARLAGKGIDVKGLVARVNSPIRFVPLRGYGGHPGEYRRVLIVTVIHNVSAPPIAFIAPPTAASSLGYCPQNRQRSASAGIVDLHWKHCFVESGLSTSRRRRASHREHSWYPLDDCPHSRQNEFAVSVIPHSPQNFRPVTSVAQFGQNGIFYGRAGRQRVAIQQLASLTLTRVADFRLNRAVTRVPAFRRIPLG